MKIELNHSNNNPFYGMKECLNLMNGATGTITTEMLDKAFGECKTIEQKEMFYSLLFSIGDITARQHNIFKGNKKIDSGGNANREGFAVIINWLWTNQKQQFLRFLNKGLFEEYTCLDHLLRNRVKTVGKQIMAIYNILDDVEYRAVIANHLYKIIKGNNPFNKMLVAKFLTLPRVSKRKGHERMLPQTLKVMWDKVMLLKKLSDLMGWEYSMSNIVNFKGYREWRKQYNGDLESVLFSTGKIKEFKKQEFIEWLDKLPALARSRVEKRLLCNTKYSTLKEWYEEWSKLKVVKQAEQRVLEEKVRQNLATEEDIAKLEEVKKQAKVTVGANNFESLYTDICNGYVDELKLEAFMNKVNLPYNSLVIIDDSGSMSGVPFRFASFLAAVCLYKNPDDDARNLLGFFNSDSHWHTCISSTYTKKNSILRGISEKTKSMPFVDPTLSFFENYERIASFCGSVFQGGWTNISSIPENLNTRCKEHPEILDALKCYPVWTIVSDGEWNNLHSPEASMNDFMARCEQYFGYRPFIVAIDVSARSMQKYMRPERFSGIKNMIYIPANVAQIEQFLTNFKDMDTFDIYTPLQSLYRSNRYAPIRKTVIKE